MENSSQSAAPKYRDSQILTIEGTGVSYSSRSFGCADRTAQHTSLNSDNLCAYDKIGTFFQNGALLGNDNRCALEAGPFGIVLLGNLNEPGRTNRSVSKLLRL
jgi:hypothetical protein